jgi:hypothetical protein
VYLIVHEAKEFQQHTRSFSLFFSKTPLIGG